MADEKVEEVTTFDTEALAGELKDKEVPDDQLSDTDTDDYNAERDESIVEGGDEKGEKPAEGEKPAVPEWVKEGEAIPEGKQESDLPEGYAVVDGKIAPAPPKEGDTRETDGTQEVFDGKDWKPVVLPWKDGEKEYTPEQLRKFIEDATNARELRQSGTNATKEAAKLERSVEPAFALAELCRNADDQQIADIRAEFQDRLGDQAAEAFDSLVALEKANLQDPLLEELSEREKAVEQKEFQKKFDDDVGKIIGDWELSDDEALQFVNDCKDYNDRAQEDENMSYKTPEELFRESALYEQKIRAQERAQAEKEAAEKKKREEEAAKLKDGTPPGQSAGAGQASEPETSEELIDDMVGKLPQV